MNVLTYRPLPGSFYIKLLLVELKSPKKGLINIKNSDQKCFLWCHVRHINAVKIYPEKITREDKKLVYGLNYDEIEFPVREKVLGTLKKRTTFASACFVMKTNRLFQFKSQIKNLKIRWICCL